MCVRACVRACVCVCVCVLSAAVLNCVAFVSIPDVALQEFRTGSRECDFVARISALAVLVRGALPFVVSLFVSWWSRVRFALL